MAQADPGEPYRAVAVDRRLVSRQRERARAAREAYTAVRVLVWARDAGRCRRCGRRGEQTHHRVPRGMGGSSSNVGVAAGPANLVLVCARCHVAIESARMVSGWDGWIVPRGHDPAGVPVRTRDGWRLLDDSGGEAPCDPPSLA